VAARRTCLTGTPFALLKEPAAGANEPCLVAPCLVDAPLLGDTLRRGCKVSPRSAEIGRDRPRLRLAAAADALRWPTRARARTHHVARSVRAYLSGGTPPSLPPPSLPALPRRRQSPLAKPGTLATRARRQAAPPLCSPLRRCVVLCPDRRRRCCGARGRGGRDAVAGGGSCGDGRGGEASRRPGEGSPHRRSPVRR